ncbi:hypothetical protein PCANC_07217 [Puccinia coronata f. sp. avenae]|uniref:Uncharacterized protein n=1 Tax=Puccinia coronata f. sp. avenae TaxID=200324 RepID=A0A2N5VU28_9BASI|nr:hypothetical protein PCANC_07217 [Puccinia coronata f. sp. avenae]
MSGILVPQHFKSGGGTYQPASSYIYHPRLQFYGPSGKCLAIASPNTFSFQTRTSQHFALIFRVPTTTGTTLALLPRAHRILVTLAKPILAFKPYSTAQRPPPPNLPKTSTCLQK